MLIISCIQSVLYVRYVCCLGTTNIYHSLAISMEKAPSQLCPKIIDYYSLCSPFNLFQAPKKKLLTSSTTRRNHDIPSGHRFPTIAYDEWQLLANTRLSSEKGQGHFDWPYKGISTRILNRTQAKTHSHPWRAPCYRRIIDQSYSYTYKMLIEPKAPRP